MAGANVRAREIMARKYRENPMRQRAIKFFNTMKSNPSLGVRESTVEKYREQIREIYTAEYIEKCLSANHAKLFLG